MPRFCHLTEQGFPCSTWSPESSCTSKEANNAELPEDEENGDKSVGKLQNKRRERKKRRRNTAAEEQENSFADALSTVSEQEQKLTSVLEQVQQSQSEQIKLMA